MIIIDVLFYIIVFLVSIMSLAYFQKKIWPYKITMGASKIRWIEQLNYYLKGILFLLPIVAMYGLQYRVGTDYITYERIFPYLHDSSILEYIRLHRTNEGWFYLEPGYYLFNKLFPNFRTMLWGIGIVIFSLVLVSLKDYRKEISFPFALFIFLTTHFLYTLNGIRFSIALCFVLVAYKDLLQNNTKQFILMVLIATAFHQTAIFCLAMYFLKDFKHGSTNSIRNMLLFVALFTFPVISGYLIEFLGNISFFSRYFAVERYAASESMTFGLKWMLHIVPVLLPLFCFCRREIFASNDTGILFRISVTEIMFRTLGLYNMWYTRFSRYSQISLVILLPLVISRVHSKHKKSILYLYYAAWYIFYFAYWAIVADKGESLPYVWVLSKSK